MMPHIYRVGHLFHLITNILLCHYCSLVIFTLDMNVSTLCAHLERSIYINLHQTTVSPIFQICNLSLTIQPMSANFHESIQIHISGQHWCRYGRQINVPFEILPNERISLYQCSSHPLHSGAIVLQPSSFRWRQNIIGNSYS